MSRAGLVLLLCALVAATGVVGPALLAQGLAGGGPGWAGEELVWLGAHLERWIRGETSLSPVGLGFPTGVPLQAMDGVAIAALEVPLSAAMGPAPAWAMLVGLAVAAAPVGAWGLARRGLGVGPMAAAATAAVVGLDASLHAARLDGTPDLWARALAPWIAWVALGAGASVGRSLALGGLVGLVAWTSRGFVGPAVAIALAVSLAAPSRRLAWALLPAGLLILARGTGNAPPSGPGLALADLVFTGPTGAGYLGLAALGAGLAAALTGPRAEVAPWAATAAVGVVLCLGPALRVVGAEPGGLPLPWAILDLGGLEAFASPTAFTAAASVGLGALCARLVEGLHADGLSVARRATLVVVLGVDAVAFGGAAERPTAPFGLPGGYAVLSGEGAVLDLVGRDAHPPAAARRLAAYSALHGAPILADFTGRTDRGASVSQRLADALVNGDRIRARGLLAALASVGVRDIALHVRDFPPQDADRMRALLGLLAHAAPRRADLGPDPVLVYHLEGRLDVHTDEALATLDARSP